MRSAARDRALLYVKRTPCLAQLSWRLAAMNDQLAHDGAKARNAPVAGETGGKRRVDGPGAPQGFRWGAFPSSLSTAT